MRQEKTRANFQCVRNNVVDDDDALLCEPDAIYNALAVVA